MARGGCGAGRPSPDFANDPGPVVQELNEMLTIAGGVLIAGAIGFGFYLGWTLTTARFASWLLRFLGFLMMIATVALSFWLVFVRTAVVPWHDLVNLFPQ